MKSNILNFENREKSEQAIIETWEKFREDLAKGEFKYNEIEKALNCVFMRQLNDFFEMHECKKFFTKELRDVFIDRNEVLRGTKLEVDENPDYERFIPKAEYIKADNRFSPEKVEWLYLAIGNKKEGNNIAKNCAIKECKAESDQRFGICHFKMNDIFRWNKLVDLTIGCNYDWRSLEDNFAKESEKLITKSLRLFKNTGIKSGVSRDSVEQLTKKWFSPFYAKLLAQEIFKPVESEKKYMYSPFQCLAMYFKQLGYDGIIYSSVVYPSAKNLVLFDKEMAKPYGDIEIFKVI